MSTPQLANHNVARNKALVLKFFEEAFNNGNLAVVDELLAPSYTFDGHPQSAEMVKNWVSGLRAGLPDLHFTLKAILGEGDDVALRWEMTGTNTGGDQPSGARIVSTGTNIVTIDSDGRCIRNIQNGTSTATLKGGISQTHDDSLIYSWHK